MRPQFITAVVRREFLEILRNRLLIFSIVLPPIILTVIPVITLRSALSSSPRLPLEAIAQIVASHPAWSDFTQLEVASAFAAQQFLNIFLILPGYIPLSIAAYSIVGEKQTRSLEAVLATPIRTTELLFAKALAALIPGIVAAWLSYLAMVGLAGALLGGKVATVFTEPTWLGAVLLLGPAIGLLSVAAGVIVSSRVNDPRLAQQIGALIILPLGAIVVLQTTGSFLFSLQDYLLLAVGVGVLGAIGIRLGVIVFGRETILTRWK